MVCGDEDFNVLAGSLVERGASLGEASRALATAERLAACDAGLLASSDFRRLYAQRARPAVPSLAAARRSPEGSLGRCYAQYMDHYQLSPDFFPIEARSGPDMTPTQYAVRRLGCGHDFLHVLGAYETHDADEVAIQSFVFGNSPVVHAAFLAAAAAHPSLGLARYKHLRDVYDGVIRREDFERGRRAGQLLALAFEELLAEPVDLLRQRLGIRARIELPEQRRNSCGGVTERLFFSGAGSGCAS